jgi:hypothetical protein
LYGLLGVTISLKRSTQNLQLSTSWAGRLPHLSAPDSGSESALWPSASAVSAAGSNDRGSGNVGVLGVG